MFESVIRRTRSVDEVHYRYSYSSFNRICCFYSLQKFTKIDVCIMNGRQYTQGQQWYDGCSKKCVCEDGKTGFYRCMDRCRSYPSVPARCTMIADPNDPVCCRVPQCIPQPGVNGFPTPGPTDKPVPITDTPVGIVTGFATPLTVPTQPTPAPKPGVTPNPNATPAPTPAPKHACVYKGTEYGQGQRWQDGCKYMCTCDDKKILHNIISESIREVEILKCPTYPLVPAYCTMQTDPKDYCCEVPVCDYKKPIVTPAPFQPKTPVPGNTPAPGHTPAPGVVTQQPNPNVTPQPTPSSGPVLAFCVYNGVPYKQGQTWEKGCDKICRCDDAMNNYYTCQDRVIWFNIMNIFRCPSYQVKQGCVYVTDPNDPCCQVPQCTVVPSPQPTPQPKPGQTPLPGQTLAPNPGQTPAPGITLAPGMTPNPSPNPSPVPTGQTGVIFGKPQVPTTKGVCEYKGLQYTTGQKFDDGCQYKCECIDGMTGAYKCTERCPRFPSIPSYCIKVQDPNDRCCETVSCPNLNPTPAPNQTPAPIPNQSPQPGITVAPPGTQTQAPNPNQTPSQGVTPGPLPTPYIPPVPKNVCIMNGKSYTQGQRWNDGCSRICVCDDGVTGHYSCSDRCPQYQNIAPSCIMVPDPKDPTCCKVPDCNTQTPNLLNPNPTPPSGIFGSITGVNPPQTTPKPNPQVTLVPNPNNPNPTAQPNPNQTPQPYPYPTPYPGGTYPPQILQYLTPNPQNTPAPGQTLSPQPNYTPIPGTPSPAPKVCVYKGKSYSQGQRWRDGCDYNCICEDGMTGKYKCTAICPRYPSVPLNCRMVTDPANPCCEKPDCSPTQAPQPGVTQAPKPGQTPNPLGTVAPNPQNTLSPNPQFCIYNGIPYRQGQTWQDGCDKICRCEDAMTKQITCDDRCATYPPLKSGCTYVTDPKDQCCQIPQCTNQQTPNPTSVVTGQKGTVSGGNLPAVGSNIPSISGRGNVCLYKGNMYQQGQTWDDGCTYSCVCIDGSTGRYKCTEKCYRIPNLPSSCTMIQDPDNQCCQKAYCPNLVPNPQNTVAPNPQNSVAPNPQNTLAPNPGNTLAPNPGSTVAPNPQNTVAPNPGYTPTPKDVCVYKNQNYKQDQMWYDGCTLLCRCENAMTGFYRCQERCSRYDSVPSECTLVPDPKDPTCCQVPQCPVKPTSGPIPTPGIIQNPLTPKPGVITGLGPIPTAQPTPQPQPGQTPVPGYTPLPKTGCYYKGLAYHKGQKWDDGCQYTCECLDDMTGQYRCVEKCNAFPNLDSRCVLVQDPQKPCCKKPYCDFVNPTPFPNGAPTPAPGVTQVPVPGRTPAPQPTPGSVNPGQNPTPAPNSFCVYKGVFYKQSQQWFDGCDQICQCDDSSTGYYSCHARCPTYNNVPSNCVLKTDPNDQCCLAPDCYTNLFPVKPTGPSGSGTITVNPNPGSGMSGTLNPPQSTYGSFTGTPNYIYPTPVQPGTFTGTSGNNPSGVPGSMISSIGGRNVCIYKGKIYNQGEKWDDGCDYRCECIDSTRGQYRCAGRCGKYVYLPPQCTYEQDPKDACCKVAKCNPNATPAPQTQSPIYVNPGSQTGPAGTLNPAQTTSNTFTGGNTPIYVNPNQNTGPSGQNPNPQTTYSSISGQQTACIYKGKVYQKGQTWQDGCDYNCVCENPSLNSYKCDARCKVYSGVPSFCTMMPDPNDACCKTIRCTAPNGQQLTPMLPGNTPTQSPTLSPDIIHVVPLGTHNVFTGTGLPVPGTNGITGGRNVCMYKNKIYQQGQSWDDGCDYVCTCEDGSTGRYKCTSKCPKFPPLPKYCKFVNVPGDCCPSLSCNSPDFGKYTPLSQLIPTPAPSVTPGPGATPNPQIIIAPGSGLTTGGSTVIAGTPLSGFSGSTNNLCIYKNKIYNAGDSWTDGCDYSCTCMDGKSGFYQCKALCPTYTNLPSQCYLVRAAGKCCPQAMCTNPDGTQINPMTPGSKYPVYGTYPGGTTGFRPNYIPGQPITGSRNICVYKGVTYAQGQRWDDGCTYSCECQDASRGLYQCRSKCPTYTAIPSVCRLLDVPGDCCKVMSCDNSQIPTTQNPNPYTTSKPIVDQSCYDSINNCKRYGSNFCHNSTYTAWAQQNCNRYCGFCTPSQVTYAPCVDKLSNCDAFGSTACVGKYQPWAEDNCRKTCGLCQGVNTAAPTTSVCADKLSNCDRYDRSACTDSKFTAWAHDNCKKFCGWMTMMKGVAGVPGDLYTIWNSPNTVNAHVPQAMYLNAIFPGHFKPDLSNHWNSLCIDRVKVAIYNKGVEKANIIFDATNTDKNGWFDPSRIISSTYSDIKNAPKQFFSMLGDVSSGREFYMNSQSSSSCNTYGWIMVATQNGCPFENSAGNKPSFLYAPGNTVANFGMCTATASPQSTGMVGYTNACIYSDNKIYHQGESWVDGCQYNCTCTDAKSGRYTCRDLCPSYTQLPQGCKLAHLHGSTWNDGCDYKCTCVDGSHGRYECSARCYTWNLPNVCTLQQPAAGMCCPTPQCPSNVIIQYPPGYILKTNKFTLYQEFFAIYRMIK
ncbi:hypothetical protein KUTeg_019379 [Tegillarca granosa]|uniref:VWFC domain-containing protein n=1 Tax=Tegillarca granosa TaxID=220873 RepID=A0ABQ9EIB0_TEGGR|nr:hypothetical protein KUTeg_019379 [Tegillarca granosa]